MLEIGFESRIIKGGHREGATRHGEAVGVAGSDCGDPGAKIKI
jgi:hypothetical protein